MKNLVNLLEEKIGELDNLRLDLNSQEIDVTDILQETFRVLNMYSEIGSDCSRGYIAKCNKEAEKLKTHINWMVSARYGFENNIDAERWLEFGEEIELNPNS